MHRFHPKHSSHLHRINMFSDVNLNCNSLMYLWVQSCYSWEMLYKSVWFTVITLFFGLDLFLILVFSFGIDMTLGILVLRVDLFLFVFYRPLDRFMHCSIIDCILIRLTVVVYLIRLGVLWQIFVWLWWLLIFLFQLLF